MFVRSKIRTMQEDPEKRDFSYSDVFITQASEVVYSQEEVIITTADCVQPLEEVFEVPPEDEDEDADDADDEQQGSNTLQETTKRNLSRIIMCVFSLCFLWLTSFQLCYYIANISIPAPAMTSVVDHCSFLYHKVTENKLQYDRCIQRQMQSCTEVLDVRHNEEIHRVTQLQVANQRLLQALQGNQGNCSSALTSLKSLIINWKQGGRQYSMDYTDQCTSNSAVQKDVQAWLSDGSLTSSSQTQILDLVQGMATQNTQMVSELADYSIQLHDYNKAYVHNKTQNLHIQSFQLVDNFTMEMQQFLNKTIRDLSSKLVLEFQSCLLSNNIDCPFGASLATMYSDIAFRVDVNTRMLQDTAAGFQSMLADYILAVQEAMAAADDFYDSINGARGIIKYIVSTFSMVGSAKSLCGKSTPNWCNFDKSDWFVVTPPFPTITVTNVLPSLEEFQQRIQPLIHALEASIQHELQALEAELAEELDTLLPQLSSINFLPTDYNPPAYRDSTDNDSLQLVVALHRNISEQYLTRLEQSLYQSAALLNTSTIDDQMRHINTTSLGHAAKNILSYFDLQWTSFKLFSVDLSALVTSYLTVQNIFFLFDYLYRGLQSVRIILRFWSRGLITLPTFDLRRHRWSESVLPSKTCLQRIQLIVQWFPLLWLQFLLVIAIIAFVCWVVASLLIPEYYMYQGTCVHHSLNETYLSANMYALSCNYISLDASNTLTNGYQDYNLASSTFCSAAKQESDTNYIQLLNQFVQNNASFNDNYELRNKVFYCYNMSTFVQSISQACFTNGTTYSNSLQCPKGLVSLSFPNFQRTAMSLLQSCDASHFLRTATNVNSNNTALDYNADDWMYSVDGIKVEDSRYNCAILPTCKVTCPGPDAALLYQVSKDCSCMLEWYWNGYLIQTTLVVFIFLMLNVSRQLICNGLLRIYWMYFIREEYDLRLNCDAQGQPFKFQQMFEVDGLQRQLTQQIRVQMKYFQRRGYLYVVLGVLLNAVWIAVTVLMRNNIAYDPNHHGPTGA